MDTDGAKPCSRVAALLHPTREASNAPSPVPGSKISPWMPGVEIAVADWLALGQLTYWDHPLGSSRIQVSWIGLLGLGTPKMGCSRNWRLHSRSRRRHWDQLLSTRPQVFKGPIASEHQTLWWLTVRCLQYHHVSSVSSTWGVIFSQNEELRLWSRKKKASQIASTNPSNCLEVYSLIFFSIHWAIAIKDDQSYLSTLCVSLVAPYSLDCIEPIIEPPPLLPPKRTKGMAKLGIHLI